MGDWGGTSCQESEVLESISLTYCCNDSFVVCRKKRECTPASYWCLKGDRFENLETA